MPPTRPKPSAASRSTTPWRSSTSKQTLRSPSSLDMASGDPGSCLGWMKLDSSSPVPPSSGRSMTISEREFGMPITVSTNSPSMNILPSTSRPSPTKNAVDLSRSATVTPTWSKRVIRDTGTLLCESARSGSRCCLYDAGFACVFRPLPARNASIAWGWSIEDVLWRWRSAGPVWRSCSSTVPRALPAHRLRSLGGSAAHRAHATDHARLGRDPSVIVVCGEALIDMIQHGDGTQRAAPGGGPFNTARALARLGVPTAFLGHLSEDRFGRDLAGLLTDDGADLR